VLDVSQVFGARRAHRDTGDILHFELVFSQIASDVTDIAHRSRYVVLYYGGIYHILHSLFGGGGVVVFFNALGKMVTALTACFDVESLRFTQIFSFTCFVHFS
jgi:hypothetical protein